MFGRFWNKQPKDGFQLKKPQDIYDIMEEMERLHISDKTRLVVNELCSNVFEHNEQARIYFENKIVHLMIDKGTLTEEKKFELKLAIIMAKALKGRNIDIKITKKKDEYGGAGLNMILDAGYDIEYKETDKFFSVLAYSCL